MLKEQFYLRLILILVVGVVLVKASMNMAKRNSKEIEPERHLILKIIGGFLAFMAILAGFVGVFLISQISFPQEAIGPYISAHMYVRPSYQTMYWGYATIPQSQCISMITNAFVYMALSAYCFMYKSSHSKWHSKLAKVIFCMLYIAFFASATDFHYFDLSEWTIPVLFAIMTYFALRNKQQETNEPIAEQNELDSIVTSHLSDEGAAYLTKIEDESRYMPQGETSRDISENLEEQNTVNENTTQSEVKKIEEPSVIGIEQTRSMIVPEDTNEKQGIDEQSIAEQANSEPVMKFCRHCGGIIDYQSDKFCKHCGKQLC